MKKNELAELVARAESHLTAGRTRQAKRAFQQILARHSDSKESHFQMAVLLHDENNLEGAVFHFRSLLQISPELAEVHFNLGTLLSKLGRTAEAAEAFSKAVELKPDLAEAHNNLGIIHRDLGDPDKAIECFESAVSSSPNFVAALLNLGTTLIKCRRAERAVEVCRRARDLNPDLADTHFALGLALELTGLKDESILCMEEAVRRKPETNMKFHLAASKGLTAPPIAPPEYVASLFDAYAARFDEHLCGTLKYQTPELIHAAVSTFITDGPLEILDLGCGTGLCGKLFRPIARRLTGIDLSSEMIREATARQIYDETHVTNISQFLENRAERYDLILAADVFVYVGDLQNTFQLVFTALRDSGLFAFSAEAATESSDDVQPDVGYRLSSTRRYTHTESYLRQLATETGFVERCVQLATLRMQAGEGVKGRIVVLQKNDNSATK